MNINDLWIGDRVTIKSSGREGVFVGIHQQGKARIKVNDKILLIQPHNLELISEKEYFFDIDQYLKEDEAPKKPTARATKGNIGHSIDLHIEVLAPHMTHDKPAFILEYQLKMSQEFIRESIARKSSHITIIHGKGQGVLKTAIEHQLSLVDQVKITFSKHGGGAIEVWL
ncbi:MAG: Smr/MutS family protein [Saprospiraceae bacterium]